MDLRFKQKFELHKCPECKSTDLNISSEHDPTHRSYVFDVICNSCGNKWTREVSESVVREYTPMW